MGGHQRSAKSSPRARKICQNGKHCRQQHVPVFVSDITRSASPSKAIPRSAPYLARQLPKNRRSRADARTAFCVEFRVHSACSRDHIRANAPKSSEAVKSRAVGASSSRDLAAHVARLTVLQSVVNFAQSSPFFTPELLPRPQAPAALMASSTSSSAHALRVQELDAVSQEQVLGIGDDYAASAPSLRVRKACPVGSTPNLTPRAARQ